MEKFKDIFWFAPKSKIKAGEGLDKGRFPFYTSSSIQNKWIDTEQHFDESLIFGTGGSASIHYESQPFSTSTDCFVTITARNDVNTKYVYYFLSSNIHLLERGFKGAGLKHLSKSFLEELEIPLPDLKTQNKIVAILDKAKTILEKREETIKKYDELLRATFLEMFGTIQKPKFDTDILNNLSIKITDGTHQSPNFIETGVPFLYVSNIVNHKIDFNTKKFISEQEYEILNKRTPIEKDDILLTSVGSYGNPAIVKNETKFAFQRHIAYIKPDKKKINPVYLYSAIRSDFVRFQIEKFVKGVAQKTLNLTDLKKIEIPLPPLKVQQRFELIFFKFEETLERINNSRTRSDLLYKSLSQLSFKGELDFNTAVDLEVLLENDYQFFKENSNSSSIKLLLERLNTDELNENRFYEQQTYDKAKNFVFELIKEGKVKQVFDKKTKKVKLIV